ncbi:MAG: hypothetical protein KME17_29230 [Cyanosarcina radialis HA8281-LM2]|jgi:hypothetical protein|nr:hypothetical protein [Cyanosarcina radialis HA8281-LM2]
MLYRLLIASTLALTSLTVIGSSASAQIAFTNMNSGTLRLADGQNNVLESSVSGELTISVEPNTSATIQVFAPNFISGATSDPNGTIRTASLTFGGTTIDNNTSGGAILPTGTNTNVKVNMQIQRPIWFRPGTYQYQVPLTVTAN